MYTMVEKLVADKNNINITNITMDEHNHRRDWSSLPSDIIHSITKLVPVPDRIRCRSLCSSWQSAILPLHLPLHWFVIPNDDGIRCTFRSLSSDDEIFSHAVLPNYLGTGINVAGSQHGYIVVVDQLLNVHLHNPFSGVHYNLPPFTKLPKIAPIHENNPDGSTYLWGFEDLLFHLRFRYRLPLSKFNHKSIKKIVFSSPEAELDDFVALATYRSTKVIYTRARDDGWRHLETADLEGPRRNDDIIFHGGKFYRLTARFQVISYDFSTSTPVVTLVAKAEVPDDFRSAMRYLAFSNDGELLVILRKCRPEKSGDGRTSYTTQRCLVMRFSSAETWDIVDNLGDYSLLLGVNNAMTVFVGDMPGIRSNCIYLTDNDVSTVLPVTNGAWEEVIRDVGIFDMKTKKFEQFCLSKFYLDKPGPIWFHSRFPSTT